MTEVFHYPDDYDIREYFDDDPPEEGWYWWACQPGCLPDGEPQGPFDCFEDAQRDADNPDD